MNMINVIPLFEALQLMLWWQCTDAFHHSYYNYYSRSSSRSNSNSNSNSNSKRKYNTGTNLIHHRHQNLNTFNRLFAQNDEDQNNDNNNDDNDNGNGNGNDTKMVITTMLGLNDESIITQASSTKEKVLNRKDQIVEQIGIKTDTTTTTTSTSTSTTTRVEDEKCEEDEKDGMETRGQKEPEKNTAITNATQFGTLHLEGDINNQKKEGVHADLLYSSSSPSSISSSSSSSSSSKANDSSDDTGDDDDDDDNDTDNDGAVVVPVDAYGIIITPTTATAKETENQEGSKFSGKLMAEQKSQMKPLLLPTVLVKGMMDNVFKNMFDQIFTIQPGVSSDTIRNALFMGAAIPFVASAGVIANANANYYYDSSLSLLLQSFHTAPWTAATMAFLSISASPVGEIVRVTSQIIVDDIPNAIRESIRTTKTQTTTTTQGGNKRQQEQQQPVPENEDNSLRDAVIEADNAIETMESSIEKADAARNERWQQVIAKVERAEITARKIEQEATHILQQRRQEKKKEERMRTAMVKTKTNQTETDKIKMGQGVPMEVEGEKLLNASDHFEITSSEELLVDDDSTPLSSSTSSLSTLLMDDPQLEKLLEEAEREEAMFDDAHAEFWEELQQRRRKSQDDEDNLYNTSQLPLVTTPSSLPTAPSSLSSPESKYINPDNQHVLERDEQSEGNIEGDVDGIKETTIPLQEGLEGDIEVGSDSPVAQTVKDQPAQTPHGTGRGKEGNEVLPFDSDYNNVVEKAERLELKIQAEIKNLKEATESKQDENDLECEFKSLVERTAAVKDRLVQEINDKEGKKLVFEVVAEEEETGIGLALLEGKNEEEAVEEEGKPESIDSVQKTFNEDVPEKKVEIIAKEENEESAENGMEEEGEILVLNTIEDEEEKEENYVNETTLEAVALGTIKSSTTRTPLISQSKEELIQNFVSSSGLGTTASTTAPADIITMNPDNRDNDEQRLVTSGVDEINPNTRLFGVRMENATTMYDVAEVKEDSMPSTTSTGLYYSRAKRSSSFLPSRTSLSVAALRGKSTRRVSVLRMQEVDKEEEQQQRAQEKDIMSAAFDETISRRYACTRFRRFDGITNSTNRASPSNETIVDLALGALDIARRAPSGFNSQPYKLVLVSSVEQKERLSKHMAGSNAYRVRDSDCTAVFLADREVGREMGNYRLFLESHDQKWTEKKWAMRKLQAFILLFSSGYPLPRFLAVPISFGVRVGVWICSILFGRLTVFPTLGNAETWSVKNTMLVAMSYMLCCTSRGLATCPMEGFNAAGVRRVLRIPSRYSIPLVVSTGRPKSKTELSGDDDVGLRHGVPGTIEGTLRYPDNDVLFSNEFLNTLGKN